MTTKGSAARPPVPGPGAHIRIVSPSWPQLFYAPKRAERADQALSALGYRVSYGEHAHEVTDDGVSAGSAEQRAADFMAAFTDPDVDVVFAAGGGGTSWELLPLLDAEVIRAHPKPFVGHCENVWLNAFLYQRAQLGSYYGAAFMAHLGEAGGVFPETAESFRRVLADPGDLVYEPVATRTNEPHAWEHDQRVRHRGVEGGWHWLAEGRGEAAFVGGEAAYLSRVIDRFALDLSGTILFWHVMPDNPGEPKDLLRALADRVDLRSLAGMVVGTDVRHAPSDWAELVARTLDDVVGPVDYPVLANADIGHTDPVWIVPYGTRAVLDSTSGLRFPGGTR